MNAPCGGIVEFFYCSIELVEKKLQCHHMPLLHQEKGIRPLYFFMFLISAITAAASAQPLLCRYGFVLSH